MTGKEKKSIKIFFSKKEKKMLISLLHEDFNNHILSLSAWNSILFFIFNNVLNEAYNFISLFIRSKKKKKEKENVREGGLEERRKKGKKSVA